MRDRAQRGCDEIVEPLIKRLDMIDGQIGRLERLEAELLETDRILGEAIAGMKLMADRVDELEREPAAPRGAMEESHGRAGK